MLRQCGDLQPARTRACQATGKRKLHHITDARPDVIATGNPGCTLQLLSVAAEEGTPILVVHPIELIDEAIAGARSYGL